MLDQPVKATNGLMDLRRIFFLIHDKIAPKLSTKCGLKLAGTSKNQMWTFFSVMVLVVDHARLFVNAFSYLLNLLYISVNQA